MRAILRRLVGTRRARLATLLCVAALVAGFTFLGLWVRGASTEQATSAAQPAALTAEDFWPDKQGMLHFCSVPGEETDAPAGWCASEVWFDPRNQRGRWESHDRDGTLESLAVVSGDTYGEYDRATSSVAVNRTLSGQTWLQWLGGPGSIVLYEAYLNRGFTNATEATVDGVSALKIETPVMGEDGTTVEANMTIYLDKATHLPIRIDREPARPGAEGGQKRSQTYSYRVLEWFPTAAVDPALFTLPQDPPEVRLTEINKEMTVEEARAFRGFDVYWLGETFQGLTLSKVLEYTGTPGKGSIAPWTHRVDFAYAGPGEPNKVALEVSNVPVGMFNQPLVEPPSGLAASGRQVGKIGNQADVSLQAGDTLVDIQGDKEDQTLAAADAVLKLN